MPPKKTGAIKGKLKKTKPPEQKLQEEEAARLKEQIRRQVTSSLLCRAFAVRCPVLT